MNFGSEAQVIARCRTGDSAAWDELFDLHYAAAARFIFQLSSNFSREDAEEICQETFLSVIRHIDSFQGNCQLQTWIFRIARNKARDFCQKQNAAKRGGGATPLPLQPASSDGEPAIDPPSGLPGPDEILIKSETAALVETVLEQLGEPCREVIELRYFGGLSYEEIAKNLNMNPKTVSSRLSKCLDRFEKIGSAVFSRKQQTASPV
jgi:RNA polymerase sigma-70 factor, ECF subfamily